MPDSGWKAVSGIVGLVAALAALYGMASLEIESMCGSPLLPALRHGAGLRALTGDLSAQVSDVAEEAGARKQL